MKGRRDMILVTGATGSAGSHVVRALFREDEEVRVFARDAERARELFGGGCEVAVGDYADAQSFGAALAGVDALFLSGADNPCRVAWETAAIDAAVSAGVRRIVKLSSITAGPGAPVAFWDWHGQIEDHLRAAQVSAVVLRSSFFMSNVLAAAAQVAQEGRFFAPAGDARIAMIHPRDVGETAAAMLVTPAYVHGSFVLTGPAAITYSEVAAELSAATGRAVEFVDVTDDDARDGMIEAGLPAFVAEQIVAIFALAREGVNAEVTGTVESLTGRPPRDFAAFAREHAELFAPVAEAVRR
jgi:uncharacterized protein YbjT (DUF2867 family)